MINENMKVNQIQVDIEKVEVDNCYLLQGQEVIIAKDRQEVEAMCSCLEWTAYCKMKHGFGSKLHVELVTKENVEIYVVPVESLKTSDDDKYIQV